MIFYVLYLNFHSHHFVLCESSNKVDERITSEVGVRETRFQIIMKRKSQWLFKFPYFCTFFLMIPLLYHTITTRSISYKRFCRIDNDVEERWNEKKCTQNTVFENRFAVLVMLVGFSCFWEIKERMMISDWALERILSFDVKLQSFS